MQDGSYASKSQHLLSCLAAKCQIGTDKIQAMTVTVCRDHATGFLCASSKPDACKVATTCQASLLPVHSHCIRAVSAGHWLTKLAFQVQLLPQQL